MKTLRMPGTDLETGAVALGLMRIADLDDQTIRTLVAEARDAGVTLLDHADIYGGDHRCERRFGDAVPLSGADRDAVQIQSKVGIRDGWYDFSTEHILESVDESLRALRTDFLDVLLLHRPDALVEPQEVAAAFDALHDAGKVRWFGVSNHTPAQIELLQRDVRQPLIANQVQLSIPRAPLVAAGVAVNIADEPQGVDRDGGLLDFSRLRGMTLQAWSPFQGANGPFVGDRDTYPELNDVLDDLAAQYGVTPTGIATAWITRHPAGMQVVIGSTSPQRVRDAAAGSDVVLSREEWYRLFRAAGHLLP